MCALLIVTPLGTTYTTYMGDGGSFRHLHHPLLTVGVLDFFCCFDPKVVAAGLDVWKAANQFTFGSQGQQVWEEPSKKKWVDDDADADDSAMVASHTHQSWEKRGTREKRPQSQLGDFKTQVRRLIK